MKLTDVCDFQGGSQPPKEEWSYKKQDGFIRMLQIRDFTQSEKVTPEYIKLSNNTKICEADDILIARYGASIGKILTGLAGAYNVAIMRTIPDETILKKRYLYYYLKSSYFQNNILNVGPRAAQAGFNKEDLSKLSIHCPKIEEQDDIVDILEKVEKIIAERERELKLLEEFIKARFVELFGDPRINPKGYEIKKISELFDVGSSKRVFESEWRDSGVPFYRAREIVKLSRDGFVDNELFIEEKMYECYKDKYGVPKAGDMMVTGVGTLGICYIVKDTDRFYFKDGNTLWFKNKGLCDVRFIKDQYDTDFVKEQINTNANVSTVGTYTITNAKETLIVVPPIEEQNTFTDFVAQIDKSKLTFGKPWQFCTRKRHGYLYNFNKVSNSTYKM